jgi:hypothetical protein
MPWHEWRCTHVVRDVESRRCGQPSRSGKKLRAARGPAGIQRRACDVSSLAMNASFDRLRPGHGHWFMWSARVPAETRCPQCGMAVSSLIPIVDGVELHRCRSGRVVTVLSEDGNYCTLAWVEDLTREPATGDAVDDRAPCPS